jgi:hypothetical protein
MNVIRLTLESCEFRWSGLPTPRRRTFAAGYGFRADAAVPASAPAYGRRAKPGLWNALRSLDADCASQSASASGSLPSLAANAGSRGMDNPSLTLVQQEQLVREHQV